jgi:hypothetical protein
MDFDNEPGGGRLNPADCLDHLLMVWAVGYIEHSPTKYSQPGKNSDVVVVDVVDLDQADEDGWAGKVVRSCWWRNARLIGLMKGRIGRPKPVLARMGLGVATMGKPPYELHFADKDVDAVQRATTWFAAHPDFKPTSPQGHNPEAARIQPEPVVQRQPSQLEILAAASVNRTPHQEILRQAVVPPPPPPPLPPARPVSVEEDEPPF